MVNALIYDRGPEAGLAAEIMDAVCGCSGAACRAVMPEAVHVDGDF